MILHHYPKLSAPPAVDELGLTYWDPSLGTFEPILNRPPLSYKTHNYHLLIEDFTSEYVVVYDPSAGTFVNIDALPQLPIPTARIVDDKPATEALGLYYWDASAGTFVNIDALPQPPIPTASIVDDKPATEALGLYYWDASAGTFVNIDALPFHTRVFVAPVLDENFAELFVGVYDPSTGTFENILRLPQPPIPTARIVDDKPATEALGLYYWDASTGTFENISALPFHTRVFVAPVLDENFTQTLVPVYDPSTGTFENILLIPGKHLPPLLRHLLIEEPPSLNPPVIAVPDFFESVIVTPNIRWDRTYLEIGTINELWATASPFSFYEILNHHTRYEPPIGGTSAPYTGTYIGTYSPSASSAAFTKHILAYIPMIIPYHVTIKEIGVNIASLPETNKLADVGIYSSENGLIVEKLYGNSISLNTLGYRMVPANISLSPGLYYMAYLTNSNLVTLNISDVSYSIIPTLNPVDTSVYTCYTESYTHGSGLPDTPGSYVPSTVTIPRIIVRIA